MGTGSSAPKKQNPNAGRNQRGNQRASIAGRSSFTPRQQQALLKRYESNDSSPMGQAGMPVDICLAMPEFSGNKLLSVMVFDFVNPNTGRMHHEEFLRFCFFLSAYTTPLEKKSQLFETFNVYNVEAFTHDEIFRLYKTLLGHVISDDHILALTFEALRHPKLEKEGQITKSEFIQLIPDSEVEDRLTVHFNIPAS